MTRYDVTAPVKGYNGETGGVRFYRGKAVVDDATHGAAVAYMRRRGYTLTEIREESPEQTEETQKQSDSDSQPPACECEEKPCEHTPKDEAPAKPKQADPKDVWVAYVVATTDRSEAEAADLTKTELQELADKEQS